MDAGENVQEGLRLKKNDIVDVIIEDMSDEGLGIGHASGMALFVKDAVVGDTVRAKVVKEKEDICLREDRRGAVPQPGPGNARMSCRTVLRRLPDPGNEL